MPSNERLKSDATHTIAGIKDPADVRIGDTITAVASPAREPLPGFRTLQPVVFSGLYPVNAADFDELKAALAKGVAFVPGQPFYIDGENINHARLNYSSSTEEKIEEGIKRLGAVLHDFCK